VPQQVELSRRCYRSQILFQPAEKAHVCLPWRGKLAVSSNS